jgi:hypothetical protein
MFLEYSSWGAADMSNQEALLLQANTHQEVGNFVEAMACIEKILAEEPGDSVSLLEKARISRNLFPSFSGSNGEYIAASVIDRIAPVKGNYQIAMKFCDEGDVEEVRLKASAELINYALLVVQEDTLRLQSASLETLSDIKSQVLKSVVEKSKRQLAAHVEATVDVASLAYEWNGMTADLANRIAPFIAKGKNIPSQAALYNRFSADFPDLNLKAQGCFPANAKVLTDSGYRSIADIVSGDIVLSCSSSGELVQRVVTRKLAHGNHRIVNVSFSDGPPLRVTLNHRILSSDGWCLVSELKVGDGIAREDGAASQISRIDLEPSPEPVFNLFTSGEHTFVVDGVVVHNFTRFPVLRTIIHRLFFDPVSLLVMRIAPALLRRESLTSRV